MRSIEERAAEIAKSPRSFASADITACLIELAKHADGQKVALEAEAAKVSALRRAGANLAFHAETTGGVAGTDRALQVTISEWIEAVEKTAEPAKSFACPLGKNCDLTVAYMLGEARGRELCKAEISLIEDRLVVAHEGTASALERVTVLQGALLRVRELNMLPADDNGHQWANSDLIEQEVQAAFGGVH